MRYLLLMLLVFTITSCGEESDDNNGSDLPDWDYANVVDENDESVQQDEEVDKTEVPDKDSGSETVDKGGSDSDVIPLPKCGNSAVDEEEFCDTIPVDCMQLNTYLQGIAYCKDSCKGYDLSTCAIKHDDGPLGVIHVDFKTDYILDVNKVGDPVYAEQGIQHLDTILGVFRDKTPIPTLEADDVWSYAVNMPAGAKSQTWIKQFAWKAGKPVYPRVEIEFSPGPLKQNKYYKVNIFTTGGFLDGFLDLVRFRVIDFVNGKECVMAMASTGEVYVEFAWQDNPVEGGKIIVKANDIDFYRPDEMPNLDEDNPEVPAEVLKYPKCP
ncbi:hypothetical protein KAH37_06805 [bacterium]|nr:hypothetical protein [bacterium]